MNKKYVLTETTKEWLGVTLYQIKAVRDIPEYDVEEGDLGGWIASENNLDQDGNAWVSGNARVYGDARVYGNARVQSVKHIFWASSVGSENGTLSAYTIKTGEIEVTRGCFQGTIDEFEAAVNNRHDGSRHAEEYLLLIQYIRLRFREVTVTVDEEQEAS